MLFQETNELKNTKQNGVHRKNGHTKCVTVCTHFRYFPCLLDREHISSLMIFEKHANLKYKYGNRHFWCRGYYVDTVGKNTAAIKTYIQNQLKEDLEYDQMSLVEYIDPFTGEPVKKNKK